LLRAIAVAESGPAPSIVVISGVSKFGEPSSSGSSGSNILPITVPDGGTGKTSVTANEILVGDGVNALDGKNLVSPDGSISFPAQTATEIKLQTTLGLPVAVSDGGTSKTSITSEMILVGDGTSPISEKSLASPDGSIVFPAQTATEIRLNTDLPISKDIYSTVASTFNNVAGGFFLWEIPLDSSVQNSFSSLSANEIQVTNSGIYEFSIHIECFFNLVNGSTTLPVYVIRPTHLTSGDVLINNILAHQESVFTPNLEDITKTLETIFSLAMNAGDKINFPIRVENTPNNSISFRRRTNIVTVKKIG
jgi:hypothetical protein